MHKTVSFHRFALWECFSPSFSFHRAFGSTVTLLDKYSERPGDRLVSAFFFFFFKILSRRDKTPHVMKLQHLFSPVVYWQRLLKKPLKEALKPLPLPDWCALNSLIYWSVTYLQAGEITILSATPFAIFFYNTRLTHIITHMLFRDYIT